MPDDLFISESPDQTYEAELSPQAQFQPMAIQNLLIPTHQHHRPPVNTSAFMSATHPHPENFNPVVLSTLLSSGRYSSASLFFGRGLSQPEGGRSPELESLVSPTRPHTRSALFLSQLQSASSARFSQTSSVSRHFDSRVAFTPHDAASRTQGSRARDESRANYGMSRLVALGGNEEQDEEISPWLDYYESNVGGTVAPRLPSLSPFNLEARLAQSFLEPPLSGDASPSTLPASDFVSRSPTSRRLRTNQLDAVTQRYLRQLKEGCAKLACQNVFCAAHPSFIPRDDKEATTLALTLSQYGEEFICLDVPEFDPDTAALPGPLKKPLGNGLTRASPKSYRYIRTRVILKALRNLEPQPDLQLEALKGHLLKVRESREFEPLGRTIYKVFSRIDLLASSFAQQAEELRPGSPVDLEAVREAYEIILRERPNLNSSLLFGTATLLDKLELGLEVIREQHIPALLIVLLNPLLMEPSNHPEILSKFCDVFSRLGDKYLPLLAKYIVARRFVRHDPELEAAHRARDFQHMVSVFQHLITMRLLVKPDPAATPNRDELVMRATSCLGLLYRINEDHGLIPYIEFYNDAINEQIEIKEDFPQFRTQSGFSFCNFPFVLNPATKSDILKVESMFQMRQELQDAFFRALFVGVNSPYLVLEIRRDFIIRDALSQLASKSPQDLKKQLRVHFVGEEGVDEGGVQKEFFQLVVREMFDAKYGMFTVREGQRLYWFSPNPFDDDLALDEYRLMGRLIGLAIYNSVILDLHFPRALYKKLMSRPVGLADLEDVDRALWHGLRCLLNFTGDVEAAYGWTFQIEYEAVGERFKHDLRPYGASQPLTNANREAFVELYVDFILNRAVERQFQAFREGFDHVCAGSTIQLFRPEEVEQLVCGSSDLDFAALERVTQYDGGFTAATPVVVYFWRVVHAFSEAQKKRLLFFATGSDRVPIGGLSKLQFVIAKNGPDSDRLPTSHTCFNVLLLCEYASQAKLRERLLTAIHNAEGFGMI